MPNIVQVHKAVFRITTPFGHGSTAFLYLVEGDVVALIDTGAASSPHQVLEPALAELGLALDDVDLILNTHVHVDHTGGNRAVKRASGAPIYLHSDDYVRAISMEAMEEFALAPLRALDFPQQMLEQRRSFTREMHGGPSGADVILSGGERIDLGADIRLTVISTPGHTPGSISYWWEQDGVLFTGDGIQGQGGEPGAYPFYMDAPSYRRTLDIVARLEPRTLCMSHPFEGGSPINDPTRRGTEIEAFLRESIRVADAIDEAVTGALARRPAASERELALDALSELAFQVPQLLVRETRMPWFAPATMLAHVVAARQGIYPRGG